VQLELKKEKSHRARLGEYGGVRGLVFVLETISVMGGRVVKKSFSIHCFGRTCPILLQSPFQYIQEIEESMVLGEQILCE